MDRRQGRYDITGNDFVLAGAYDGAGMGDTLQEYAKEYYMFLYAALVVLVLVVVWCFMYKGESFNPGQTMRAQQREDTGASNYVQQSGVGIIASEQNLLGPAPGTVSWKLLQDPGFNCAGRASVGDDAWVWMANASKEKDAEGMTASVPMGDDALTRVMSGQ